MLNMSGTDICTVCKYVQIVIHFIKLVYFMFISTFI